MNKTLRLFVEVAPVSGGAIVSVHAEHPRDGKLTSSRRRVVPGRVDSIAGLKRARKAIKDEVLAAFDETTLGLEVEEAAAKDTEFQVPGSPVPVDSPPCLRPVQ